MPTPGHLTSNSTWLHQNCWIPTCPMGSCLSLSILGTGDSVPPTDQNLQVIPDLSSHSISHVSANATGSKLTIYAGSKNFFWYFLFLFLFFKNKDFIIYYLRESECMRRSRSRRRSKLLNEQGDPFRTSSWSRTSSWNSRIMTRAKGSHLTHWATQEPRTSKSSCSSFSSTP